MKRDDVTMASRSPAATSLYFVDFNSVELQTFKSCEWYFHDQRKRYATYQHSILLSRGSCPGRHSAVSRSGRHSATLVNMCVCVGGGAYAASL